jgi:hypothetical protein
MSWFLPYFWQYSSKTIAVESRCGHQPTHAAGRP